MAGHFAERPPAERHLAERTFCRRIVGRMDFLPKRFLAEKIVQYRWHILPGITTSRQLQKV